KWEEEQELRKKKQEQEAELKQQRKLERQKQKFGATASGAGTDHRGKCTKTLHSSLDCNLIHNDVTFGQSSQRFRTPPMHHARGGGMIGSSTSTSGLNLMRNVSNFMGGGLNYPFNVSSESDQCRPPVEVYMSRIRHLVPKPYFGSVSSVGAAGGAGGGPSG
ncbi:unnamed protein product, partial [Amoebophrya sp. A120]